MVRPGFMPLRMASNCTGVKRTLFFLGTSCHVNVNAPANANAKGKDHDRVRVGDGVD